MELKAYQYMNEYLKERYPLYYKKLEKTLFHSNILTKVYNEYGTTAICRGYADDVLDGLIDDYMKHNYRELWLSYSNLCSYIKKLILSTSKVLNYKAQFKILNFIVNKIALSVINNEDIDKVKYLDGSCDEKIIEQFKEYEKGLFNNLCSHIDDIVRYSGIEIKCNKATYNYLRNMMIVRLLEKESIDKVIYGSCDDFIIDNYNNSEVATKEKIKTYVKNVIDDLDFPFGMPENQIIEFLNRKVFEQGELNVVKIFDGQYDSYIVNYGYRLKNEKDRRRAQARVDEVIVKNVFVENLTEDEMLQYGSEIFQSLIHEYNCTLISISTGRCDDLILKLFNRKVMKKLSVVDENKPKKIKHKTTKKMVGPIIRKLLIIAVATSLFVGTVYGTKNVVDIFQYNAAYNDVLDFDGYDYNFIFAVDNERVQPTGENTLEFYRKIKSADYNEDLYGYLAFYSAYVNVRQDKLYIMDQIMKDARCAAKDNEYCASFYEELSNCSCFLEFAMNRLVDMGCDEVKGARYVEALEAYNEAAIRYKNEKPMNMISEDDVEIIEDIMRMYRVKCQELILKFNDVLEINMDNQYDVREQGQDSKTRRSI